LNEAIQFAVVGLIVIIAFIILIVTVDIIVTIMSRSYCGRA